MLISERIFRILLGLGDDWAIKTVTTSPRNNLITVRIAEVDSVWTHETCPSCHQQPVRCHDHQAVRTWLHLIGFNVRIALECATPRGQCVHCKKVYRIKPAWEGASKHFTRLFEVYALSLMKEMPIKRAAGILGEADRLLWRMLFSVAEGGDAESSGIATKILRNEWVAGGVVVGFDDRGS